MMPPTLANFSRAPGRSVYLPVSKIRVLGLPPSASELQFIDQARVDAARKRVVETLPDEPLIHGSDPLPAFQFGKRRVKIDDLKDHGTLSITIGCGAVKMTISDEVRAHALQRYVEPARKAGKETVDIRAGDIHRALKLRNRSMLVCGALSSKKFQKECGVKLLDRHGDSAGMSTVFVFSV
jgi:hypothetical protein